MKIIILLILSSISSIGLAATDQVPRDRTITNLYVYAESVIVEYEPAFAHTQNCPENTQSKALIDLTVEQNKSLYSAVLSAAAAKNKVGFGLSGCKNNVLIYRVDVVY